MPGMNEWLLSPKDSKRIECSAPIDKHQTACGRPATTAQNIGGVAPFWYHCDEHAEKLRRDGHAY